MSDDRQRGIVLVTALWVVMLLALCAVAVVETTRAERHIGRNVAEQARLQAAAEAGINRAIIALLDRQSVAPWRIDGTAMKFTYADTEMTIAIEDEFGKVDLNAATGEMLSRLFAASGADEAQARAIADAVEDWRDKDDLRHVNGAERSDYEKAGRSYGPRNAALESTAELLQVQGVTAALFDRIRPALTVHSMRQFVDPQTAPRAALRAIAGLSDAPTKPSGGDADTHATTKSIVSLTGRAVTLRVDVKTPSGAGLQRQALVRFTDDPARPYWIQEWRMSR